MINLQKLPKTRAFFQKAIFAAGALSAILSVGYYCAKYTDLLDSPPLTATVLRQEKEKVLEIPRFNSVKLPPYHCSRFARLASSSVFDKHYPAVDAWNLRYENLDVTNLNEKGSKLEELIQMEKIAPGVIIGIYNPRSPSLRKTDKTGNPVKYTHVGVYIGKNKQGKALIAHQFGTHVRVDDLASLHALQLLPVEAIAPKL